LESLPDDLRAVWRSDRIRTDHPTERKHHRDWKSGKARQRYRWK
jgi:hypothetical protein